MSKSHCPRHRASTRWLLGGGLVAASALAVAACGSSYNSGPASSAASLSPTSAAGASSADITVAAANVPGVGTVLVNGEGRTLYLLTSTKGGKFTCTDDNGCTKVWPDTELPAGTTQAIAGSGIQPSLLSTLKSPDGHLYTTYAGWLLYTYTGDTGPGRAHGQGIVSFGGTWETLTPNGSPVTATSPGGSSGY